MIGINPKTKEITTIKSKLLALKPISKFDNEEIEYDFSLLKETDEFSYTKSYIITEDKSYHVAILSFNKLTAEVDIVKIY
jgi:hypothetical protein